MGFVSSDTRTCIHKQPSRKTPMGFRRYWLRNTSGRRKSLGSFRLQWQSGTDRTSLKLWEIFDKSRGAGLLKRTHADVSLPPTPNNAPTVERSLFSRPHPRLRWHLYGMLHVNDEWKIDMKKHNLKMKSSPSELELGGSDSTPLIFNREKREKTAIVWDKSGWKLDLE